MEGKVLNLYKKVGETPLECIERFRDDNPEYSDVKMSYAGRLDPMAEGVLLVLVGEENKNREKYLNLEKTYSFDVLFGVETDSYDVLGLITNTPAPLQVSREDMVLHLKSFEGEFERMYPPYSSKPIEGKASFIHARKGNTAINQPSKVVLVRCIELKAFSSVRGGEVLQNVTERIHKVSGDFRQDDILISWREKMKGHEKDEFTILTIEIACGSGTYVRSIAHELGKKIEGSALAYSIVRSKVGDYNIKDSIRQL